MDVQIKETSWLWHRRLRHTSMNTISKLIARELIKGLQKLNFEKNQIYDVYQLIFQIRKYNVNF